MLVAAAWSGGCVQQPGLSERDEELNRVKVERRGYGVHSVSPTHSVIRAGGRNVIIEAAAGRCIAEDSFAASAHGVFLALTPCRSARRASVARNPEESGAGGASPVLPGVLSVSVVDLPLFGVSNRPAPLRELRDLLGTTPGQQLLRRGDAGTAEFIDSQTIGNALYVRVRENGARKPFATSYWRAFLEINERLTLVTFSAHEGRNGAELELAQLVRQVVALRKGNGLSVSAEATALLGEVTTRPAGEIAIVTDPDIPIPPKRRVRPNQTRPGTSEAISPAQTPMAPARPIS